MAMLLTLILAVCIVLAFGGMVAIVEFDNWLRRRRWRTRRRARGGFIR